MTSLRNLVFFLIVLSLLALLFAPLLMPESYDWVEHTTSESGAQGMAGAWLARMGFVFYGAAVLLLSVTHKSWQRLARLVHSVFGAGMIGNAVFSSRPWQAELPFSELEDLLHSWMSGLVGTAFTVGVIVVFFARKQSNILTRSIDITAVLVSIGVTLVMFSGGEDIAGLVQRVMFAVSYIWYAREAVTIGKRD